MGIKKRERKKDRELNKSQNLSTADLTESTLLNRSKDNHILTNKTIIPTPPNIEGMSEIILEFANPIIMKGSDNCAKIVIALAIFVWNMTILPDQFNENDLDDLVEHLADDLSKSDAKLIGELHFIINYFKERKIKEFSQYNRLVLDYQMSMINGKCDLSVVSAAI
jgi:hypothetical protein